MHELISVVAFFSGVPLFIIGWVMSVIAARKFWHKMGRWHGVSLSRHLNAAGFNPLGIGEKTSARYDYWHRFNTRYGVLHFWAGIIHSWQSQT